MAMFPGMSGRGEGSPSPASRGDGTGDSSQSSGKSVEDMVASFLKELGASEPIKPVEPPVGRKLLGDDLTPAEAAFWLERHHEAENKRQEWVDPDLSDAEDILSFIHRGFRMAMLQVQISEAEGDMDEARMFYGLGMGLKTVLGHIHKHHPHLVEKMGDFRDEEYTGEF